MRGFFGQSTLGCGRRQGGKGGGTGVLGRSHGHGHGECEGQVSTQGEHEWHGISEASLPRAGTTSIHGVGLRMYARG